VSEFLSFDEATEDQRRQVYDALVAELIAAPFGWSRRCERVVNAVRRPKPQRYVVELRPPKKGERFVDCGMVVTASGDYSDGGDYSVIVDEATP